jgi:hypothetical protein
LGRAELHKIIRWLASGRVESTESLPDVRLSGLARLV